MATLVGSKLPVIVAFALAAFNLASDHEVLFELGKDRMEVTLHHPAHNRGAGALCQHQHNLAERLLVGSATSGGESDHHFGLAHESSVTEEEKLRPFLLDDPAALSGCAISPCLCPIAVESICTPSVQPDSYTVQTPHALRRGVIMRV